MTGSTRSARADSRNDPAVFVPDPKDMDALHILPLALIPFRTNSLRRAKLIKNTKLESVVEMFRADGAGSGQVDPKHLSTVLDWSEENDGVMDLRTIQKLCPLHSYDVYTLRIELRANKINVEDYAALRLSEEKRRALSRYMIAFTAPLIGQVFSGQSQQIHSIEQLLDLFRNPDRSQALANLRMMASKLNVEIHEIGDFLEDYGDIFLSLAYYKDCLDTITPKVWQFLEDIEEFNDYQQLRGERALFKVCAQVNELFTEILASLTSRFELFHRRSKEMWKDVNAQSFLEVQNLVTSQHTTLGAMLCGLGVKMAAWEERYSDRRGSPLARAEYVMSEFRQGLDTLEEVLRAASNLDTL